MTVEWHTGDDEPSKQWQKDEPVPSPRSRWPTILAFLLILVILGSAITGGLVWRTLQNQIALMRELSAVVQAESRAQAFGMVSTFDYYANPEANWRWRADYYRLFENHSYFIKGWEPPASAPQVVDVALAAEGTLATVTVEWRGLFVQHEERRYRWVEGAGNARPYPFLLLPMRAGRKAAPNTLSFAPHLLILPPWTVVHRYWQCSKGCITT